MKKARSSKKFIKYPVTTMLTLCGVIFFVVFIVWFYLLAFIGRLQIINNICGSIIVVDIFGTILLFIIFGKKWVVSEFRERNKRFKQKVKASAKILLMQHRTVLANSLLVLCPVFLMLIIAFAPTLVRGGNVWAVATFIPLFVLLIVLGAIFSFVTPKEYVRYEGGKIYLFKKPYLPSQITSMKKIYNYKNNNTAGKAMRFDYKITLDSGEEIYFPKADTALNFEGKIKEIQDILKE